MSEVLDIFHLFVNKKLQRLNIMFYIIPFEKRIYSCNSCSSIFGSKSTSHLTWRVLNRRIHRRDLSPCVSKGWTLLTLFTLRTKTPSTFGTTGHKTESDTRPGRQKVGVRTPRDLIKGSESSRITNVTGIGSPTFVFSCVHGSFSTFTHFTRTPTTSFVRRVRMFSSEKSRGFVLGVSGL